MPSLSKIKDQARETARKSVKATSEVWHGDQDERLESIAERFAYDEAIPLIKSEKFAELEKEIEQAIEKIEKGQMESKHKTINPKQKSPKMEVEEEEFKSVLFWQLIGSFASSIEEEDQEILQGNTRHHGKVPRGEEFDSAPKPKFKLPDFGDGNPRFVNDEFIEEVLGRLERKEKLIKGSIKTGEDVGVPEEEIADLKNELDLIEERRQVLIDVRNKINSNKLDEGKKEYEKLMKRIRKEEN